jgi:tetratricopeptide (TPR) repeat protein
LHFINTAAHSWIKTLASLSGRAEWAKLREASKVAPMLLARLRPPTESQLRAVCAPSNTQFNIVHFICHGLPGALALEDDRGLMKLVSAQDTASALKDGGVQLAVINACYSAAGDTQSMAQALVAAGIRSVVAHRWPLIDPAAVVFTQSLYRELAAGRSLRVAFDRAVQDTTEKFEAEKGNAIIEGDDQLKFPRPDGEVLASQVFEGSSLPDESARFFGRRQELLLIADVLNDVNKRGVALTGIGGMGKSALAFEAGDRNAWRFQGGVTYVRAPETGLTAKDALADCARGLHLEIGDEPERTLREYVNAAPCLLIFDNMERAGSEVNKLAEFVASLNMDAGSKVLFTLRPPLSDHFSDVREINLTNGLDEHSAIDYAQFIAYNENAAPQWRNFDEAKALVDRVKGHPELIRLIVNRSKKIPFAQVKTELAALSGKLDEALQEMIGKQVNDAGELAMTALTRLSIFPQPRMIAEAAIAACGDAVAGLEALVDHGVIAFEADGVQRYALHPTVIDWVKRHGAGEQGASLQEARQRVVIKYVEFVEANWENNDLLADEHDNLIASLEWAWSGEMWPEVSDLAWHVDEYLSLRGYWSLATTWMERGLKATHKMPESNERQDRLGKLLQTQATYKQDMGDLNGAMQLYQQSFDIAERLGDLQGKAATLHQMADVLVTRGDLNGAMQLYQQSFDIAERLGDLQGKATTLHQMGRVLVRRDNLNGAMALYQQSLDIHEQLGNLRGKAATLHQMADVLVTHGDLNGAMQLYQQSFDIAERLGDLQGKAATLAQIAYVFTEWQDFQQAEIFYLQGLDILEQLGDRDLASKALSQLGNIKINLGDWDEARRYISKALNYAQQVGNPREVGLNFAKLGQIAEHDMNLGEAAKLYRESIGYFEKLGSPVAEQVKELLANVLKQMGANE